MHDIPHVRIFSLLLKSGGYISIFINIIENDNTRSLRRYPSTEVISLLFDKGAHPNFAISTSSLADTSRSTE